MQHVILQEVEAATLCCTELGGKVPSLPEAEPWAGGGCSTGWLFRSAPAFFHLLITFSDKFFCNCNFPHWLSA